MMKKSTFYFANIGPYVHFRCPENKPLVKSPVRIRASVGNGFRVRARVKIRVRVNPKKGEFSRVNCPGGIHLKSKLSYDHVSYEVSYTANAYDYILYVI